MDLKTQPIIAYLENTLPVEEKQAFEAQLKTSPELQQELEAYRFVWQTTADLKACKQIDTEKNWKILSSRIAADRFLKSIGRFTRNVAAILLLPLILVTFFIWQEMKALEDMPVEQVELYSANGLVTHVTLSDGSEVWLNSGTKLSYPQRFTGETRHVTLSGEAYFKVNANPKHRFVVSTDEGVSVHAYGTEFNVCAYSNEETIESTLVSGHIVVDVPTNETSGGVSNDLSEAIRISNGQQVVFHREDGRSEVENVNVVVKTAWKDGKLIFRRANMQQVARSISRHFNVDIQLVGKDLQEYEYTATFTTESLDEILYLLEKSAPIKCEIIYPEQVEDYSFTKRNVLIRMRK